ncbi:MAG: polynucleotide adenylyltransferase region [Paenibacillaceae bacterium]|nr:polynucleotide adenylyltransferase region [Paenibacillaceae bacterium]
METLEQAGFEAYFVGGYVRDRLWGKPVKDIDIATSALPEAVTGLFARTIPTGLQHGTVTVMMEGIAFEVTTFRKDSDYADYRRPDRVEFISDLEEDLRRRDFTVNAMAMDRNGNIRDPFGGRQDMERKLLRCVGDPEERFSEDALRMLRCVRFASAYGLEVDARTWQALLNRRELLSHVAMERVRVELARTLAGPDPLRGLRLAADSGLLAYTKEPLEWSFSRPEAECLSPRMAALEKLEDPLHRWILVMMESRLNSANAEQLLRLLTFSGKEIERIVKAVKVHEHGLLGWPLQAAEQFEELPESSPAERWKLGVLQSGVQAVEDWLVVMNAVSETGQLPPEIDGSVLSQGPDWLTEMPLTGIKELAVSGQDLIRASGKPAGPWVGQAMARLLKLAAAGRIANNREELIQEALNGDW